MIFELEHDIICQTSARPHQGGEHGHVVPHVLEGVHRELSQVRQAGVHGPHAPGRRARNRDRANRPRRWGRGSDHQSPRPEHRPLRRVLPEEGAARRGGDVLPQQLMTG